LGFSDGKWESGKGKEKRQIEWKVRLFELREI